MKQNRGREVVKAGRASSIGLEFAMTSLLGLGAGYWADTQFGTQPWLALGGFFLGVGAGFWSLFKAVQAMANEADEENHE